MSTFINQFVMRRYRQDVFKGLVTGLRRLVLTSDVKLGNKIGIGGYADVYEGTIKYMKPNGRKRYAVDKVAVKVFRVMFPKESDFAEVRKHYLAIANDIVQSLIRLMLSYLLGSCASCHSFNTRTYCH